MELNYRVVRLNCIGEKIYIRELSWYKDLGYIKKVRDMDFLNNL